MTLIPSTPLVCSSGPGVLNLTDTQTRLLIANDRLLFDGGTGSWAQTGFYGTDNVGNGFARTQYMEFEVTSNNRSSGSEAKEGLSVAANITDANFRHYLYAPANDSVMVINDGTGGSDLYVGPFFPGQVYTVRIYLRTNGGAVWLIKGGQFGTSFQILAVSTSGTTSSLFPAISSKNSIMDIGKISIIRDGPPKAFVAYCNGATSVGGTYKTGRLLCAIDGWNLGQDANNPVLSPSEAYDTNACHCPAVMLDGSTWKMWYAGKGATSHQICYATSTDGITWTKYAGNPVMAVGGSGAWDENEVWFFTPFKDKTAPASKRWKALYQGQNSSGTNAIGYAYSADGIVWTKGSNNPVVGPGPSGSWDSASIGIGGLVYYAGIFYLFYGGVSSTAFPQTTGNVGLVTFNDFEGSYYKDMNNPLYTMHSSSQSLTADFLTGSTYLHVASTSGYAVDESVWLLISGTIQWNRIAEIVSSTVLRLAFSALRDFTTTNSAIIQTGRAVGTGRDTIYENGVWSQWLDSFHIGIASASIESNYYGESSTPTSGWQRIGTKSPALMLSGGGLAYGWNSASFENVYWARNADDYTRVVVDLSA